MRVAVLAGGRSSEHEISLASAESVAEGLRQGGHEPVEVRISREGRWSHGDEPVRLEPGAGLLGADVVFPALHGPYGEDGVVQGLLEALDVPYVGAGVAASSVSMDKILFKDLMAAHGVPQVDYARVRHGDPVPAGPEPPVFVKPARLGSSVGISRADTRQELERSLELAFEHDPLAIVEGMARGLEVECSVLGDSRPRASEPGEIVIRKGDWYDYEAKYEPGGMELVVPARLSDEARGEVQELALRVFDLVGCSGMARVDFFVEDGRVLVNELNTIPGFTPTSVYARLFDAGGLPYPQLLDELLQLAMERYERERSYRG